MVELGWREGWVRLGWVCTRIRIRVSSSRSDCISVSIEVSTTISDRISVTI